MTHNDNSHIKFWTTYSSLWPYGSCLVVCVNKFFYICTLRSIFPHILVFSLATTSSCSFHSFKVHQRFIHNICLSPLVSDTCIIIYVSKIFFISIWASLPTDTSFSFFEIKVFLFLSCLWSALAGFHTLALLLMHVIYVFSKQFSASLLCLLFCLIMLIPALISFILSQLFFLSIYL